MSSVEEHSAFFDTMLSLIPVDYYYPVLQSGGNQFTHNKKEERPKQSIKEASKKALKRKQAGDSEATPTNAKPAKRQAREQQATKPSLQDKFDPTQCRTILDVQQNPSILAAANARELDGQDGAEPDSKTAEAKVKDVAQSSAEDMDTTPAAADAGASASLESLRHKLHAKLDEMRTKRRRDQQEADRAAAEPLRKRHKAEHKPPQDGEEKQQLKSALKKRDKPTATEAPVVHEKAAEQEPDLQFGRIETKTDDEAVAQRPKKKKANVKKLLEKAEQFEAKLEKMNPKEAGKLEHNKLIKAALLKSQGITVYDNKKLLKKSLKREENKKKQSQKKWEERKSTVETEKNAKHDKRAANIADRKDKRAAFKAGAPHKAGGGGGGGKGGSSSKPGTPRKSNKA